MIASTPPMGWNSWDCYGASVNEETVRKNAEFMAKYLKQYGWEYIVVDIQWYEPTAENHEYHSFTELCMDEFSRLVPAENRFPSSAGGKGFAPLAEYVHSLGLKFGIHIMRGVPRQAVHRNMPIKGTQRTAREIASTNSICNWNTDMYGIDSQKDGAKVYYNSLFELYASWEVDFVKVDDICNHYPEGEVELIQRAIQSSGREMVLSLSPGPAKIEKAEHLKQYANMWRITDDFWDKWELLYDMFYRTEVWCIHAEKGHWPDADMLPIGAIRQDYNLEDVTKFTKDEQMTMLTLWCMMRSPLMIGAELTKLDAFSMSLLTNKELIEILQHTHSAHPLFRRIVDGNEQIAWFTSHEDGRSFYVALFNAGEEECEIAVDIPVSGEFEVYDIWESKKAGVIEGSMSTHIAAHGAKVFKLTR